MKRERKKNCFCVTEKFCVMRHDFFFGELRGKIRAIALRSGDFDFDSGLVLYIV